MVKPDVVEHVLQAAIACVNAKSQGEALSDSISITLHFHPESTFENQNLIENLVANGIYRSQFETGTSNGSLSAHKGGRRWVWEQTLFGGAYDNAPSTLRPKYGALNYQSSVYGASPRFGSCYLRLKTNVHPRCTFAYPDSHMNPEHFGTAMRMGLIPMVDANALALEPLDNYIEAHVHGVVDIAKDVDAIVLDPSYKNSATESAVRAIPVDVQWHDGFSMSADKHDQCVQYRGKDVAEFIQGLTQDEVLTPARLGDYRGGAKDEQLLKKAWHCLARFGRSNETAD